MVQSSFINNLYRLYGVDRATPGIGGEVYNADGFNIVNLDIDLTTLTSTSTIIDNGIIFPAGARLHSVSVIGTVPATSGGSPTLDVGLIGMDRTTVPTNGGTAIVKALAMTAFDASGENNILYVGSTGAGDLLGTTLTNKYYVTVRANTATYTAGKVRVRIVWYKP